MEFVFFFFHFLEVIPLRPVFFGTYKRTLRFHFLNSFMVCTHYNVVQIHTLMVQTFSFFFSHFRETKSKYKLTSHFGLSYSNVNLNIGKKKTVLLECLSRSEKILYAVNFIFLFKFYRSYTNKDQVMC